MYAFIMTMKESEGSKVIELQGLLLQMGEVGGLMETQVFDRPAQFGELDRFFIKHSNTHVKFCLFCFCFCLLTTSYMNINKMDVSPLSEITTYMQSAPTHDE